MTSDPMCLVRLQWAHCEAGALSATGDTRAIRHASWPNAYVTASWIVQCQKSSNRTGFQSRSSDVQPDQRRDSQPSTEIVLDSKVPFGIAILFAAVELPATTAYEAFRYIALFTWRRIPLIMAKSKYREHQPQFKFRKNDTIGTASAEDDAEFLSTCFVQTEDYDALRDTDNIRQIVLGRTGSGKSALFARLKQEYRERVITIDPHHLALTYVANSSVIRYFADLGVNLDPFYKLLWRHVLTVEILRTHFDAHDSKQGGGLWQILIDRFNDTTRRDKNARKAVSYLKQWGEQFWVETEYRVREITGKVEDKLYGALRLTAELPALKSRGDTCNTVILSKEEKIEVISRARRVVSEAQIQDLDSVLDVLKRVLTDRQKIYYVLIDRLDENWIEDTIRYRLIMALIDAAKELSKVSKVKIIIAIRRDLADRVFRLVRATGAGFQEEKYQSLYLPLHWSPKKIIEILDKRVEALVARRYQKNTPVKHTDVLPRSINKKPISQFITERAQRPRDVIAFFNKCIEEAEGKQRVSADTLRRAEGEYSRQRLRALGDEWYEDYPELLDYVRVLKRRPEIFPLRDVTLEDFSELCLNTAITQNDGTGNLSALARRVLDDRDSPDRFKHELFMVFYKIGLVGLKLETFESPSWVDELGRGVSSSEIGDETRIVVHITYRRALGIRSS